VTINHETKTFGAKNNNIYFLYIVLVTIRIACFLFNFNYKVEYLHSSGMFIMGKFIVHLVLCEFVWFMN
jgi:hypothetical protein